MGLQFPHSSLTPKDLGHHFILSCSGSRLTPEERKLFESIRPAGVLLWGNTFEKSLGYPAWVKQLDSFLAEIREATQREQIIVCIDHEGGRITRTPKPYTMTPAAGEFATYARTIGQIHGAELFSLGVNLSFGPVLDIFSNPANPVIGPRSFGDTPEIVSQSAAEYLNALKLQGVHPCLKHFPGHGDVSVDTHFGFASVLEEAAVLRRRELKPFENLIREGLTEAVMTAHVSFPSLDKQYPATLSRILLQDILRQEFGFQGVIISDDVDMDAMRKAYSNEACARLLRKAGVDLILFNHQPERAVEFATSIATALERGELSEAEEKQSQERITNFLSRLAQPRPEPKPESFFLSHVQALGAEKRKLAVAVPALGQEPEPRKVLPPQKSFAVRVGVITEEDERSEITFTPEFDSPGRASNGKEFLFRAGLSYQVRVSEHELFLRSPETAQEEVLVGILTITHPQGSELRPRAGIRLHPIVAGRHFHWKKEIEANFVGGLEIHPADDKLLVINTLDYEAYIACVVGSEMSGKGLPDEFAKAQATAARSWAYTFLGSKYPGKPYAVCNDDMSQRYQGTTHMSEELFAALAPCKGEYLVDSDGHIVAAYYSKSTGGHGEAPENVFFFPVPGLGASYDCPPGKQPTLDLRKDEDFAVWLKDSPTESQWRGRDIYCSPEVVDDASLGKFLGVVDTVSKYFRWQHSTPASVVKENLRKKFKCEDVAALQKVVWGPRGVSGRYISAVIEYVDSLGREKTFLLPNQFAIRGCFHESFLFSSAVVCSTENLGTEISMFHFHGAGWGHGAGLCQIGALGMALGGTSFPPQSAHAILQHYFSGSQIVNIYHKST